MLIAFAILFSALVTGLLSAALLNIFGLMVFKFRPSWKQTFLSAFIASLIGAFINELLLQLVFIHAYRVPWYSDAVVIALSFAIYVYVFMNLVRDVLDVPVGLSKALCVAGIQFLLVVTLMFTYMR